jgi:limonene-1,2-epoxide hydrolase
VTNEEILQAVFRAWGDSIAAGQEAMRTHLTDDCRWEQTGVPTTTGGAEAAELLAGIGSMGFLGISVDVVNLASTPDVVFTERVDWMLRDDGSKVGPWPVVGVTEFRDGRISAWREYFDSRIMDQLAGDGGEPG